MPRLKVVMYINLMISLAAARVNSFQIQRNASRREAIFLKRFSDTKLEVPPLETINNVTLVKCARCCLTTTLCDSFNYKTLDVTECNLLKWNISEPAPLLKAADGWNYYEAQRKFVLPCMRARLGQDPGPYSTYFYGDKFKDNPGKFCEQEVDGGGWTIISLFSPGQVINKGGLSSLTNLYLNQGYMMTQDDFVRFSGMFEIRQIRFYCHNYGSNRKIDIATTRDVLGEKVISFFRGEIPSTERPTACGSFYRLSPDNAYISRKCEEWADGKWNPFQSPGYKDTFYENPFNSPGNGYCMTDGYRKCDEFGGQSFFAIFVR